MTGALAPLLGKYFGLGLSDIPLACAVNCSACVYLPGLSKEQMFLPSVTMVIIPEASSSSWRVGSTNRIVLARNRTNPVSLPRIPLPHVPLLVIKHTPTGNKNNQFYSTNSLSCSFFYFFLTTVEYC